MTMYLTLNALILSMIRDNKPERYYRVFEKLKKMENRRPDGTVHDVQESGFVTQPGPRHDQGAENALKCRCVKIRPFALAPCDKIYKQERGLGTGPGFEVVFFFRFCFGRIKRLRHL